MNLGGDFDPYEAPVVASDVSTDLKLDFDGRLVVHRAQDVEPLIEQLAALRQVWDGRSESGDMYHVGDIPMSVVESYLNENGVTYAEFMRDDAHVKRILQNPDFSKFRVFQGRF